MGSVIVNTPYDDVYKTMYTQCDELVLLLLNEVFGEHYTGKEKIIRRGTESFETDDDGSQDKRENDSFMEVYGERIIKYHMECESSKNGDVTVKMFRYGSRIAIEDSEIVDGELYVRFPTAAVIFLRKRSSTPKTIKIHVEMPTGESIIYPVRTLKVLDYDIDEIFEKRLYFLIPFYIFKYENRLKDYEDNPELLQELQDFYVEMFKKLEKCTDEKTVSATDYNALRGLTRKVIENLAYKQKIVQKGLGDVMGGKVLDLEVFRIRDECIEQGIEIGEERGIEKGIEKRDREKITDMLRRGKKPNDIVEFCNYPINLVLEVQESLQAAK